MARSYDSIIVGGGHNGLVCAAYLARAGQDVLVLERRHVLGGAAVTEEVFPGFKYSVFSYVVSLLRPQIIRDLELARFGLELMQDNHAAASAFVRLQVENLGNPRPGLLYKIWRASHPPLGERIDYCNDYRPWESGQPLKYGELIRP